MMCSAVLMFIICAVTVTNVDPREITRPKRAKHKFGFEDTWSWGFSEETFPFIKTNTNYTFSLKFVIAPEFKLNIRLKAFETKSEPVYPLTLPSRTTTVTPNATTTSPFKPTDAPRISVKQTKPTDTPFTSRLEPIPSDSTTTKSTTKRNGSTTSSIITIKTTDAPTVPTKETKSSNLPGLTMTESNLASTPLTELRLANLTYETSNDKESQTMLEDYQQQPTTTLPETTTRDLCDPLPGKPDFSAPGRRINEEQCMGYVWELKNRIKQTEWDLICKRRLFVNHAVGGRKADVAEFPHMGALGWKAAIGTWVFKCGSSLISPNFVLTAAHCAKASDKDSSIADPVPKIVRLGDRNIVDTETFFTYPTDANISRIIVHPQYNPPMKYYDIALMELEEPVEFTRFIQPACLWNSFSTGEPGHEATLTGWGVIESGSLEISPALRAATVDVLDTAQCDELLKDSHSRNWKGFQEHQLCAGKLAGGVDSCQGDSGGPLQVKMPLPNEITKLEGSIHYVIGIISFGVGCAHPNLPGVYTRVSSFIDWIEENVWKNGHNRTYVKPPTSNVLSFSL